MDQKQTVSQDMSLDEILKTLEHVDSGEVEYAEEETNLLQENLLRKVDAIKFRIDQWEKESERFYSYVKEFTDAKKAVDAKKKRLLDYVTFSMKARKFEKIPGEKFLLALRNSKRLIPSDVEVDPTLFREYPDLIKRTYAISKEALTKHLKQHGLNEHPLGHFEEHQSAQFKVRKEK